VAGCVRGSGRNRRLTSELAGQRLYLVKRFEDSATKVRDKQALAELIIDTCQGHELQLALRHTMQALSQPLTVGARRQSKKWLLKRESCGRVVFREKSLTGDT